MKKHILLTFCFAALLAVDTVGQQVPSVQMKIKEKSGFLGLGGPRNVEIQLSNQSRQLPLSSENISSGQYYYFLYKPVGDWKIDADAVKDDISKLMIYQNEQKFQIAWKSDILVDGAATSILLGYPKTVKLHQLFLFQIPVGEALIQAEFNVPQEYWPGYASVTDLFGQAERLVAGRQYRDAIPLFERIIENPSLQIFPQFSEAREQRTKAFDSFLVEKVAEYQSAMGNPETEIKERIAKVDEIKPQFQFVVDSLPRPALNITSIDVTISPILSRARDILFVVATTRDSLQRALDDKNIRWILEGSSTGKNGYLFVYMVEAIGWALSSLDFADTGIVSLKYRLPSDQQARLAKFNITESFETFMRVCNERFQTRLPMLPIEFLPAVRKDTAAFSLPFYSISKAVNDYFYGNYGPARDEIFKIFRTCYESEISARFDYMRTLIAIRRGRAPAEVLRLVTEAEEAAAKKDDQGAKDKFEQARIIAPNFGYPLYALGRYFVRVNDQIRAINAFTRAYQVDTLYLSAFRECYNLYRRQGIFKSCIEVLTQAIESGNDYWETNYNIGIAYQGDGDYARSIQAFEHALSISPRNYETNIQLGLAYQNIKNYPRARDYFNKALEIDTQRNEAVDYLQKLNELQRAGK
ncbi:MAG: tetratricopeptide repeat protein [Ignavibacteriales bacterium]|nr:tetratricopeptide repeat protein [Ignavibacteriales bacterium]